MFRKLFNALLVRETALFHNRTLKPIIARNMTLAFGQSELIDKWKTRFEEEKVPEVEASLENILGHVLDKDKVKIIEP